MSTRSPKPADAPWIIPYLTVKDVDQSLDFYQKAFGFEKKFSMPGQNGRTAHAEMVWQGSTFMLGGEGGPNPCRTPTSSGTRSPVSLYVYCQDVDQMYKRAVAEGAKSEAQPQDMFWGDRMCSVTDPDGHSWSFATNVADFDQSKIPDCV